MQGLVGTRCRFVCSVVAARLACPVKNLRPRAVTGVQAAGPARRESYAMRLLMWCWLHASWCVQCIWSLPTAFRSQSCVRTLPVALCPAPRPAASCRGGTWRGLLFRVPAFLPRGRFGSEAACYSRCMYAEDQKSSQQAQARFRVCSWYATCLWFNLVSSRGAGRRVHRFAIRACPFSCRFVHAQHRQYVRGLPVTAAGPNLTFPRPWLCRPSSLLFQTCSVDAGGLFFVASQQAT